eukprot:GSMAST32.ASY1.ANO1.1804.1 assembled CDS
MGKRHRARARQAKKTRAGKRKNIASNAITPLRKRYKTGENTPSNPVKGKPWGIKYLSSQRTLVVGDGDFSFSEGLVHHRDGTENLMCTSYDGRASVCEKYRNAEERLERLKKMNLLVVHKVNATKLSHTIKSWALQRLSTTGKVLFDRIIFNFPHSGKQRVHLNRNLLRDFFASAREILMPLGEVHVTLKLRPPYSGWQVDENAAESGFEVLNVVRFNPEAFPGYRHQTTEADAKMFIAEKCSTLCYGLNKESRIKRRQQIRIDMGKVIAANSKSNHNSITRSDQLGNSNNSITRSDQLGNSNSNKKTKSATTKRNERRKLLKMKKKKLEKSTKTIL